jgi:hypothetical protein
MNMQLNEVEIRIGMRFLRNWKAREPVFVDGTAIQARGCRALFAWRLGDLEIGVASGTSEQMVLVLVNFLLPDLSSWNTKESCRDLPAIE